MGLEKLEEEMDYYLENVSKEELKKDLEEVGIGFIDMEEFNFENPDFEIPVNNCCYKKVKDMSRKALLCLEGKCCLEDSNLTRFVTFFEQITDYQNADKMYWQGIHFLDCFKLFVLTTKNLKIPESVGLNKPVDLNTTLKLAERIKKIIMNYLNFGERYSISDRRLLYNFFITLENTISGDKDA